MEILIAIPVVLLAVGALTLGLAFGPGAIRRSCGDAACRAGGACAGCARRREAEGGNLP